MVFSFNNGQPEDFKNIRIWRIEKCPSEVKRAFNAISESYYDENNSIAAFDISDNKIYGVIFGRIEPVQNAELFVQPQELVDYIAAAIGLHVTDIAYSSCFKEDFLRWMLNECHRNFCNDDFSKEGLYIWTMNNGELIFSRTKQDKPFFPNAINEVSGNFMRILL